MAARLETFGRLMAGVGFGLSHRRESGFGQEVDRALGEGKLHLAVALTPLMR